MRPSTSGLSREPIAAHDGTEAENETFSQMNCAPRVSHRPNAVRPTMTSDSAVALCGGLPKRVYQNRDSKYSAARSEHSYDDPDDDSSQTSRNHSPPLGAS